MALANSGDEAKIVVQKHNSHCTGPEKFVVSFLIVLYKLCEASLFVNKPIYQFSPKDKATWLKTVKFGDIYPIENLKDYLDGVLYGWI